MPDVTDMRGLLVDCVQDLREGEAVTLKRLPKVVEAVISGPVAGTLHRRLAAAQARADDLDAIAASLGVDARGPENLWMSAMLEDAGRDTEMVEKGPLLDIALIGAVRKMVVASRVSYETAVAVARRLGLSDAEARLGRACDAEAEADRDLHAALDAIAGDAAVGDAAAGGAGA